MENLIQTLNDIATTLRIAEVLASHNTYGNAVQDAKELVLEDLDS